ncbi:hypothetical protein I4U23_012637 [Adineta vaga]|nr:hypothetical protein I4U23_012637 [Adineta vaga]
MASIVKEFNNNEEDRKAAKEQNENGIRELENDKAPHDNEKTRLEEQSTNILDQTNKLYDKIDGQIQEWKKLEEEQVKLYKEQLEQRQRQMDIIANEVKVTEAIEEEVGNYERELKDHNEHKSELEKEQKILQQELEDINEKDRENASRQNYLEMSLRTLRHEIARMQKELQDNQVILDTEKKERAKLENAVEDIRLTIVKAEEAIKKIEREIEICQEEARKLELQEKDLKKEVEQMTTAIDRLIKMLDQKKRELVQLQTQVDTSRELVEQLKVQVQTLQTQIQTHNENLAKITQHLNEAEVRLKEIDDQRKALEEQKRELEKTAQNLDDTLIDKQNQLKRLQQKLEAATEVNNRTQTLVQQLTNKQQELTEEVARLNSEAERLTTEVVTLTSDAERLVNQKNDAIQDQRTAETANQEAQRNLNQLKQQEREHKSEYEREKNNEERCRIQIREVEWNLYAAENEVRAAQAEVNATKSMKTIWSLVGMRAKDNVGTIKSKVSELKDKLKGIEFKKGDCARKHGATKEALASQVNVANKAKTDLNTATSKVQQLTEQSREAVRRQKQSESNLRINGTKLQRMNAQLNTTNTELERRQEELRSHKTQMDDVSTSITNVNTEIERQRRDIEEHKKVMDTNLEELKKKQNEYETQLTTVQKLKDKTAEKTRSDTEVKGLKAEKVKKENELRDARARVLEQENKVKLLDQQLELLKNRDKQLCDNAKVVEDKLQQKKSEIANANTKVGDTTKIITDKHKHDEKRKKWMEDHARLLEERNSVRKEHSTQNLTRSICQKEVELAELGYKNKVTDEIMTERSRREEAQQIEVNYEAEKRKLENELNGKRDDFAVKDNKYAEILKKLTNLDMQIRDLDAFLNLNLVDEHRKLKVKYGRGLLLYGPPGTGKSELLKCAAAFSGITTITIPLAAGELNRPLVGETEKLLVDIMHRSNTIPYLITTMIIDEIDGLVPKRDNNAQQSKVDGISVLLSHIEGVKDIPNLIVLGATNRRNMMDDAFLRRMQGKCFVGRPSPKIRENMLRPLLVKDGPKLDSRHIDFLVRITTNFSGAAIGSLRSNIVATLDQAKGSEPMTEHALLTLADGVAREFSCWFGMETLPNIFRLYLSTDSINNQKDYSLESLEHPPSGRILVNLTDRTCVIEFANDIPSYSLDLHSHETSTLTLLSRFINGCSSRNIDTFQIIDLNFLIKNNAFEENQIFELLTTLFLECEEYNRSMLIFDIDSLIMLSVSDSAMSKSTSISNIRLYQFIREKCKSAVVEQKQMTNDSRIFYQPKEKWMVMIVKNPFLRNLLIEDIDFKKTKGEAKKIAEKEKKQVDDETVKKCPKCQQNYIPSKTNHGSCHYHNAFVYDVENQRKITREQAQTMTQKAKLVACDALSGTSVKLPKLIWGCCLGLYGADSPCQVGSCGLPEEIKETANESDLDPMILVRDLFMNNKEGDKRIEDFLKEHTSYLY